MTNLFRIDKVFVKEGQGKVVIDPKIAQRVHPEAEAPADEGPPAPAPAKSEPVMSEEEAREIAQGIIGDAQKQADALLDEAAEQAQEVRRQAWQEGHQEGEDKAKQEFGKQRDALARQFAETLENVLQSRDSFLQSMEKDLLALAVDIARKIIHTEIDAKNEAFLMLVQNALNHMKSEGAITLRLSPDDYGWYGEAAGRFLNPAHSTSVIHVVEDPMLLKGSCILESDGEAINAGIETQLSSARQALMEEADIEEYQ